MFLFREVQGNIRLKIDELRLRIRILNWYLKWNDLSEEEINNWQILKKVYISRAKNYSKLINYEWKKEYEEEK